MNKNKKIFGAIAGAAVKAVTPFVKNIKDQNYL